MRIGFYAPLKPPDHPVPSGDRQMARLLIAALREAGHAVEVYSRLRTFTATADAPTTSAEDAATEVDRVADLWRDPAVRPALLFTYHLYYKAPDLLGPALAARFGLPYVTAEASLSPRRATGPWAERQAVVAAAVRQASLNLCLTARDRAGLSTVVGDDKLADLPPFVDAGLARDSAVPAPSPGALVTVAMMRPGDKLDSYRLLAAALDGLTDLDWRLTIVGDGAARAEVHAAFGQLPEGRLRWIGAVSSDEVVRHLRRAALFVWPGLNEAFGLCYLEAQAEGLPVVAVHNAGTPAVIRDGETGLLTAPAPSAFAAAVRSLILDPTLRDRLGAAARRFVHEERSLPVAARRLDALLARVTAEHAAS